jgi:two-component system OmpR family sensor kinase
MSAASGIRVHLAARHAGSTLLALLVAGLAVHLVAHRVLDAKLDRSLRDSAAVVQRAFRSGSARDPASDAAIAMIVHTGAVPDQRVTILRPDGAPLPLSPPGQAVAPRPLPPPLRTVELALDPARAPGWRVRIQASERMVLRTLRLIDLSLALGVTANVLLATIVGWWLAGRMLKPIGEMAAAAELITAANSADRLPVANPHDELGRLGRRFNALLDRLEHSLAQQRRFLADAAHELRTPIARMMSNVEAALSAGGPDAQHEALAMTRHDLACTAVLVDELLQLAHADAGQREARRQRLYLDDLALDAMRVWRATADQRGVRLIIEDIEETPADVDPVLVRRLIDILLDNAIRYTSPCGTVTVRVRPDADAAVLEVVDTGIGIAPEEQARVFERFYRGPAARRMAPEGSGLGLPIAEWIATSHRGRISVAPAAGGGTIARVELPPDATTAKRT